MLKVNIKLLKVISFIFLISCQPIEQIDKVVFDYDQLSKIDINAKQKIINELYQSKFDDPYIDHSLANPPKVHLKKWFENNLIINGSQNLLEINILEASLKKTEIPNTDSKKYKEKIIFLYEIILVTEFILYDDDNFLLANVIAESKRTTTSSKFISLFESERIISDMILSSMFDFTKESEKLIKDHMINYIF